MGVQLSAAVGFAAVGLLVVVACQPASSAPSVAAIGRSELEARAAASPVAAPPVETPIDRADAWEDVWEALQRRPLRLPAVADGQPCPLSDIEPMLQVQGIGRGPIYPVPDADGAIRYGGGNEVGGWKVAKVLWWAKPVYRGPALIRGHQLDGSNELGFPRTEGPAATEMRFPIWNGVSSPDAPEGWRQQPSWVGFHAPGCYAFQIDGISFSRTVVFRALP